VEPACNDEKEIKKVLAQKIRNENKINNPRIRKKRNWKRKSFVTAGKIWPVSRPNA